VVATFLFGIALAVDWFVERRRKRHVDVEAAGETHPVALQSCSAVRSIAGSSTESCVPGTTDT
jgi:hypothetical protein